jgi:hypothetical protein
MQEKTDYQEKKKKRGFATPKELFSKFDIFGDTKYVTKEFQDYGYRLALQLNDLDHKSLYIKLARNEKRFLLEQALRFTVDYPKAQKKGSIFMWKLKELKAEQKKTEEDKAKEEESKQETLAL